MEVKNILRYVGVTVAVLVVICLIFSMTFVIDAGFRGVKSTFGEVEQTSYQNGFGFKSPFTNVIKFDVRAKTMKSKTSSYTADVQTAEIEYIFMYNLKGDNVHLLYENVGLDYESKKIVPILNDVLKDVIGKWQAQELVANRDSARTQIVATLQKKVDPRYFENINFRFDNIDYSDNFEKAIEAKVIAEQEAQKAINETRKIKEQAEQKIITAKAEAEAMEIKSEALAKNKGLTEYEAVQKWDGKLPVYMLGNSVPMINLNGK